MSTDDERPGLHTYQIVLRHIEAGILSGEHRVGDQLPTERDLAAELSVSRSAVREAMRVLQTQGLITSSTGPGRGTRIAPARGDALARLFQLHLSLSTAADADLTETRIALERSSAALAAQRADSEALQRLEELVEAMNDVEAIDDFNSLDTEMHVLIARISGAELTADLTVGLREAVRERIRASSKALPDWTAHRDQLIDEHRQIVAAITGRDPAAAANLVEHHIRRAYRTLGIAS
ncbi:GntR family transcriptional regulator [Propionicimonas paludicola]|uniref:GntR family transcriptional regulator n=1 Tax=Propionicimonas paludicola TaxID=185243 RepID=A0A2A9CRR5_9ACTN|nr:FadR/GntR family transcriptional regulator [Propionicimonas paludicola]PFG17103.1 GntR family transcriptional regulator [Propionicimonas paludicola]